MNWTATIAKLSKIAGEDAASGRSNIKGYWLPIPCYAMPMVFWHSYEGSVTTASVSGNNFFVLMNALAFFIAVA